MRKSKLLLLGAGAAALLTLGGLAGLAQADMDGGGMGGGRCGMWRGGGHGMMGRQLIERYDANKDGVVTQAEIDQNRQQWLAEFDTNKDGTLSLDEFKMLWLKNRNEMMVREFQFFDRDGNGQVTIEEYKGPMADIVANRDTNNDGSLGADDRPGRDGQGWRQGRGMMRHGMMGGGRMGGGGNCGDGDGPGQPGEAPDDAPDGSPDEPANP
ncbi:MAG: EF-hand domain-containing protein [Hyphomicrobiales bacterium]|uniref:EF-hand domain-containing protein n=1 Tax=Aestuariivirga sp. TaxID=2650926 RepID=UPI0035B2B07E